jgi:hypothetical protein
MDPQLTVNNRQLSVSATNGIIALERADWDLSQTPVEDFLSVLALRMVLSGYLVGSVTRTSSETGTTISVEIDPATTTADTEHAAAARALMTPVAVYADMAGIEFRAEPVDTGIVPIPLLIIGGAVTVAATIAHSWILVEVAKNAAAIVDGVLRRKDASEEIQKADAEVIKLVNNHVQREQDAGKVLPLDEATKSAISGLNGRVNALVTTAYKPNVTSNTEPASNKWLWGIALAGALTVGVLGYAIGKGRSEQHGIQ